MFATFLTIIVTWAISVRRTFSQNDNQLIITTKHGQVEGQLINNKVRSFTAIPYAKPPLNELRYQPPQSYSWNNLYNATQMPIACIQPCLPGRNSCPSKMSENCLFLNIYTPLNANNLSVLLFIHGGSYLYGWSGDEMFTGIPFVTLTNNILVTINYRLGALGFLWDPSIGIEGNMGYKDQVFAIEWIYENIVNFGGNNNQIYIFGESAGANAVGLHVMNMSNYIIKGAIMESNPISIPLRSKENWGNIPLDFEHLCNCQFDNNPNEQLSCLQNTSVGLINLAQMESLPESIQDAISLMMPWSPTVGTGYISTQPLWAYQQGKMLNIPIIIGTNANESVIFIDSLFPVDTSEEFFEILKRLTNEQDANAIYQYYNVPKDDRNVQNYSASIATDAIFICPCRNITKSILNYYPNNKNIYWYHFDHVSSFDAQVYHQDESECDNYVCHGAELPYIFYPSKFNYTTDETNLSEMMRWYWATFSMLNGNPNNYQQQNNILQINWESYNNSKEATLLLDTKQLKISYNQDTNNCNFWDEIGYIWINKTNMGL